MSSLLRKNCFIHSYIIVSPTLPHASITVISRQTLSVFEDSGWYTVDYEAGVSQEKLLWGASE